MKRIQYPQSFRLKRRMFGEDLEEVIIAHHHPTADNNRKLCKELGGILDKDKRCIVAETKVLSFNYNKDDDNGRKKDI